MGHVRQFRICILSLTSVNNYGANDWYQGSLWYGFYEYEYYYSGEQNRTIIKINPETCMIEDEWDISEDVDAVCGLEWIDDYLWVADCGTPDALHKFNNEGELVDTFVTGVNGTIGVAWDGQHIWYISFNTDLLYKIDLCCSS